MIIDNIKFTDDTNDIMLIEKIMHRATKLTDRSPSGLFMDISATHASHPLDLQRLLDSDDFNFLHDIFGIQKHLNRETGLLDGCFCPRFTAKYTGAIIEAPEKFPFHDIPEGPETP